MSTLSYFTSLTRYATPCPFLHRSSTRTLRTLCAATVGPNGVNGLVVRAQEGGCPVMGAEHHAAVGAVRTYASIGVNNKVLVNNNKGGINKDQSSDDKAKR